jgi:cytochrome c6
LKRLLFVLLSILAVATFTFTSPALAGDAAKGGQVFSANCASCHAGGKNLVNAAKTLQKSDLEKYDMYSLDKITYQVVHGKNAMPAFGGRLNAEQIENVATYVLSKADNGWAK